MIEKGFALKNVKKLGVNSQSCKFCSSYECVEIGKQQKGSKVILTYLTSLD